MRLMTILLTVTLLSGCASIPLGTMLRLSAMDEQTLWQLDPAQIRVKVATPAGFEVDTDTVELSIRATHLSGDEARNDFSLEVLESIQSTRSGGLFRSDIAVNEYTLALPQNAVEKFKDMQHELRSYESGGYDLSVRSRFSEVPDDARAIRFWVDIQLDQSSDYMVLFNGVDIPLDR